jgi:hypothetical protein
LAVPDSVAASVLIEEESYDAALDNELLRASQQEFLCAVPHSAKQAATMLTG